MNPGRNARRFLFYSVGMSIMLFLAGCYGDAGITTAPDDTVVPRGFFASRLVEYRPAPGQFVKRYGDGTAALGAPDSALVTLGGLGGSITVEMPVAITNREGADLVVWGNAMFYGGDARLRWAEPAVVEVSADLTTWLVLRGSLMGNIAPAAFAVVRTHLRTNDAVWPVWAAATNELRLAAYDLTAVFSASLSTKEGYSWTNGAAAMPDGLWGYADCTPALLPLAENWVPDDPAVQGASGAGGDAFDLAWAVRRDGTTPSAAELENLRYVRISSATGLVFGSYPDAIGEFSPEINAIGIPP